MENKIIVVSEGLSSKSFEPLMVCCMGAFMLFKTYN